MSSRLIVATARKGGVAGRRLVDLSMVRVCDLVLVVVVVVGLEVGPKHGRPGLPGPRRLRLDLTRTATKRGADALSEVAVEVRLLGEVITAVVASRWRDA